MSLFAPNLYRLKEAEVRDLDKLIKGVWRVCRNRDCNERKKLRTAAAAVEQDLEGPREGSAPSGPKAMCKQQGNGTWVEKVHQAEGEGNCL